MSSVLSSFLFPVIHIVIVAVAIACCLLLGPRTEPRGWRYLAAAGFAVTILSSLLSAVTPILYQQWQSQIGSFAVLGAGLGVVHLLITVVSTALITAGVVGGRSQFGHSQFGHSQFGQSQTVQNWVPPQQN